MANLEDKLQHAFVAQGITSDSQRSILSFLELLAQKDQATYEHSIRVGLLTSAIGEYLHLDSKALLYAGLLHDIGKSLVNVETLRKTEGFGEKDYEEIRQHAEFSYRLLRGMHDFTADVVVRHHHYQLNSYPDQIPEFRQPYSKATESTIDFYAMLVSLADFYDSACTRVNDKHGEKRALSKKEVKQLMLEKHPHFQRLIDDLYRNTIFEDETVAPTLKQQQLSEQANTFEPYRTARSVRDDVQRALALEPLSEKPGCTTRSRDYSRHLKLEYFITGAINVGDAFEDLAQRILASETQPPLYDLAKQAQIDCKRNREGGRINQGMIEMLTPIIAAQLIYDKNRSLSVDEILDRTADVLQHTTHEDVQYLVELKRLAHDLCAYQDRQVSDHAAKSVAEYYTAELATADRPVSVLHNSEFVNRFPTVRRMYKMLMAEPERELNERIRDVYLTVRADVHQELVEGGLTADCCGIALYLLFSQNPKEIIVR